jgi:hypothetical protein
MIAVVNLFCGCCEEDVPLEGEGSTEAELLCGPCALGQHEGDKANRKLLERCLAHVPAELQKEILEALK